MKNKMQQFLKKEFHREALETTENIEEQQSKEPEIPLALYGKIMEEMKHADAQQDNSYLLSEEDQEALRIGREVLQRRRLESQQPESNLIKVCGKKKRTKVWIALAATMILVLGLGISSVGSKNYILDIMNKILGTENVVTINTDTKERKYTASAEENAAYEVIKDKMGFQIPQFGYMPEGMEFDSYYVSNIHPYTKIFYNYKGKNIIIYSIVSDQADISYNISRNDNLIEEYSIRAGEQTIEVKKYKVAETAEEKMVATVRDEYASYSIVGVMDQTEFDTMIQNLFFLEK